MVAVATQETRKAMGYDLTIGEAEMRVPSAEEVRERQCSPHIRVAAKGAVAADAPTFPGDVMTGNSSSRSPSYSGWHDFCRETGLTELFHSEESGLLREHPGCAVLTSDHHTEIAAALDRYRTMVEHTARRPEGVRVLALLAPWSRTRGTQHTMRLAREHGLPVEVLACPEALGPRGGR
jgi:hypothetical protein